MEPKTLYHASRNKNLKFLKPENKTKRDEAEGKVVFATPSKALASCFLVASDDSWTNIGEYNRKIYMIISDKKRFFDLDKGGVIYSVSSKEFTYDKDKGMQELEWTCKNKVKILDKEIFESGLVAMKKLGVKVCFVGKRKFKKIINREISLRSVLG